MNKIKLYNNSKIKDEVLLPIIKFAMKTLNLKGSVIVLIKKGFRGGGTFCRGANFKDMRFGHYKWISSDFGKIVINPDLIRRDSIRSAELMYETIMHEFKHAFDWKNKTVSFDHSLPYSKRPCEISARFFAKYEVKQDEEMILNLAIEIERIMKERGWVDQ